MEQPKRPAHPYACFASEQRADLLKQVPAGEKAVPWIGKRLGEMWKAMSAQERKPYETKAAELKKEFEIVLEKFKAQGGVMTKKRKGDDKDGKGKRMRLPADENRPKKPTAGAWGVFLNENRAAIMRELPKGFQATDIGKEASKRWKSLSDVEKGPYQNKYEKLMQDYQEAMKNYKPPAKADNEEGDEEEDEAE